MPNEPLTPKTAAEEVAGADHPSPRTPSRRHSVGRSDKPAEGRERGRRGGRGGRISTVSPPWVAGIPECSAVEDGGAKRMAKKKAEGSGKVGIHVSKWLHTCLWFVSLRLFPST